MPKSSLSDPRYKTWVAKLSGAVERIPKAKLAGLVRKVLVSTYPTPDEYPDDDEPAQRLFPKLYAAGLPSWLDELHRGAPRAVEVAVDVLGKTAPEDDVELMKEGLALGLWAAANDRIADVLVRSASKSAFDALLGIVRTSPSAQAGMRRSAYDGGCREALRALEASGVVRYKPVKMLTSKEWDAMTPAQRERAQELRDDRDPSEPDDVAEAEGLLGYLGEKRCSGAQARIAQLYADHPSENVRIAAGHALVAIGDDASLACLVRLGDVGDEWRRWFAAKAHIAKAPAKAVDSSGGADFLISGAGEETALRALDVLNVEAEAAHKCKKKPWVLQDRRWLDIAAYWVLRGKEGAGYVFRFVPAATKASALARARASAKATPKGKAPAGRRSPKKSR